MTAPSWYALLLVIVALAAFCLLPAWLIDDLSYPAAGLLLALVLYGWRKR